MSERWWYGWIGARWSMAQHGDDEAPRWSVVLRVCCMGVLVLGVTAMQSTAQRPVMPTRLDGRVSAGLRTQVIAVVDSAVAVGLPEDPLIDKALEGASKGADERRIVAAVRAVAAALGKARQALGKASGDELAAGASALRAGVLPASLADVRRALPGRSLVVPLSVLEALVAQGTPSGTATAAVVAYAKRNDDVHMLDFGRAVARAITAGVAPQTAVLMNTGGGSVPATPPPVAPRPVLPAVQKP